MELFGQSLGEITQYALKILPSLFRGLKMTVALFIWTMALSIPLGLPFALGGISKIWPVRVLCKLYIWIFRGTPLMLQLFFFYFFLPIGFNIRLDAFPTAVVTFVLNYAAYLAEIYRAGIQSIDRGQYEAAKSLGLSRSRTMFGIILPQMARNVLPPVANEMIVLVKDTALVSVIGVSELIRAAQNAVNRDVNVTAYAVSAVIYLLLTLALTAFANALEKRFSRHIGEEAR